MNVRRNLMNEKEKQTRNPTTKTAGKPSGVLFPSETQKNPQRRETHM